MENLPEIILALATLITALATAIIGLLNTRHITEVKKETAEQTTKIDAVKMTVDSVQVETNGMKEKLVNEVRNAAFARGKLLGADEPDPEREVPSPIIPVEKPE